MSRIEFIQQSIDLLKLGTGTKLHFVRGELAEEVALGQEHPVITITGLRNPCPQIEKHKKGLQEKFIIRDAERRIVERKAGVMSTVDVGGVKEGDADGVKHNSDPVDLRQTADETALVDGWE